MRINGACHLSKLGNCCQQRLGVVMLRIVKDLFDRAFLNLVAAEHHDHPVGDLRHHRHIVRDKQHSRAGLALQAVNQCQNFGLDGHIQRGCRFIGDQQTWLAGKGHRDHHTLTHTA